MLRLKLQYFGHLIQKASSLEKTLMAGKDWGQEEKRATEDEMVGWHHQPNGYEFQQTLGDSEGQGNLALCSPWGHKVSDTTEQLNNDREGPLIEAKVRRGSSVGLWGRNFQDVGFNQENNPTESPVRCANSITPSLRTVFQTLNNELFVCAK